MRWLALGLVACVPVQAEPSERERYLDAGDASFRREALERDLVDHDNGYAQARLEHYATGTGWDALPERDMGSIALARVHADALQSGATLDPGAIPDVGLLDDEAPTNDAAWIELGRRVWFEVPFAASPSLLGAAREGRLTQLGLATWDDAFVGVRQIVVDGEVSLAATCAICHASIADAGPSAVQSNRELDLGGLRLLALAHEDIVSEIDTSSVAQLQLLPRGHSDPLDDGRYNPYAFPDLGGIADVPYLHHTANWTNTSVTTLAIRVETTFITASGGAYRIPRELAWAAAMYLRSLPPPAPLEPRSEAELAPGRDAFTRAGCPECHTPPLYTSDRLVPLAEVGTDPASGESPSRGTGYYRIPSLRGVGRAAPYLHDGSVPTLEVLFDPARDVPGHTYGLDLSAEDRAALIIFLRGI